MMSTSRRLPPHREGVRDAEPVGNDNGGRAIDPPTPCLVSAADTPALDAVARLSTPSPERLESHVSISPEGWQTLTELVTVLASIASRVGVDDELRWRVAALQRAVEARDSSPLPLALGDTGREPPPVVVAWAHERGSVDELGEVAVWFLADGACALAEGADLDELRGAWALLDSWAAAVAR